MKTLALRDGDLVVAQTGHAVVSGAAKIRQDLALALGEQLGNDRFHVQWGSILADYIGTPIDDETEFEVRNEVARVLAQYIAIQDQEVYRDYLDGTRSRFATADVVRQVNGVETFVDFDAIRIRITLTTRSGEEAIIARTVTR